MQQPRANSCFVALIHNNDKLRNAYAIPALMQVCATIGATLHTVQWQPPLKPHAYGLALRRELHYLRLELGWARYRLMPFRTLLQIFKRYLTDRLPKYVICGERLAAWRRRSVIEAAVTGKHILAWQNFMESGLDAGIFCEDDVVLPDGATERLTRLLQSDFADIREVLLYADLAGGLAEQELQIHRLVRLRSADRIRYRHPTTNTACCYLLSRRLAADFLHRIALEPRLRLMGIDWMMNGIFIDQRKAGLACDCLHFDPPIFNHGTFTGSYMSWQRSGGLE